MTLTGFHALSLSKSQLSLAAVLRCGQSFRWLIFPVDSHHLSSDDLPTHEYRFCLRDRVVCLRQSSETLFYKTELPVTPESLEQLAIVDAETLIWLKDYFQLDVDLVKLYDQWCELDPVFKQFGTRFSGIRMLRQDPWENLVSFICSSNNNISRITKMVQSLCQRFSPPLLSLSSPSSSECHTYHPFPPPSVLAKAEVGATLRALGFGYRAEYIHRTAKMLVDTYGSVCLTQAICEPSEAWLRTLREYDVSTAREELVKLIGVGRKVADCVLLMSLDKPNVIPVDTHVHQIAVKHYGLRSSAKASMSPKIYDEVSAKLSGLWGSYAGWAHSVLFTADLKSFSSYGLPKSQQTLDDKIILADAAQTATIKPESPSPTKRKRGVVSEPMIGQRTKRNRT